MKSPALLAGPCAEFPRRVHISYLLKGLLIALRVRPKYSLVLVSCLALCACQPAAIRVQYISVPTYVPVPATLSAPTIVTLNPGINWGQAVGSLYTGLESCNADKAAIRTLKAPPPYK